MGRPGSEPLTAALLSLLLRRARVHASQPHGPEQMVHLPWHKTAAAAAPCGNRVVCGGPQATVHRPGQEEAKE
jgi:hypothetical protein